MFGKPNISLSYDIDLVTIDNLPCDSIGVSDILSLVTVQNINMELINQTSGYNGSVSLMLGVPSSVLVSTISTLNKFRKDIPDLLLSIDSGNVRISTYVEEEKDLSSTTASLCGALSRGNVELKLVSASGSQISFLIYERDVDKAVDIIKRVLK